jgi:hypothetical protein
MEKYRDLAEECARQAEFAKDTDAKIEWLKLAESWQVLAENAEKTTTLAENFSLKKQLPHAQ